jgi:hypothetical protein
MSIDFIPCSVVGTFLNINLIVEKSSVRLKYSMGEVPIKKKNIIIIVFLKLTFFIGIKGLNFKVRIKLIKKKIYDNLVFIPSPLTKANKHRYNFLLVSEYFWNNHKEKTQKKDIIGNSKAILLKIMSAGIIDKINAESKATFLL